MSSGSARNTGTQHVHFIRRRFQYTDAGLLAGVKIGRLPLRAFVHSVELYKAVAFNSTSTDTLQLGSSQGAVDMLAATDIHSTGYVALTSAAGLGLAVGPYEEDIWAKWVSGGGAPSAGDATLIIVFTPDNDG